MTDIRSEIIRRMHTEFATMWPQWATERSRRARQYFSHSYRVRSCIFKHPDLTGIPQDERAGIGSVAPAICDLCGKRLLDMRCWIIDRRQPRTKPLAYVCLDHGSMLSAPAVLDACGVQNFNVNEVLEIVSSVNPLPDVLATADIMRSSGHIVSLTDDLLVFSTGSMFDRFVGLTHDDARVHVDICRHAGISYSSMNFWSGVQHFAY